MVDEDLLRFSSLRELVLSANSISDLHSGSLPSALRVSHSESDTLLTPEVELYSQ